MAINKNFSTEALAQVLFEQLALSKETPYYLAYSGGMDSTVLLHALAILSKCESINLTALHVNHNLQADSAKWQQSCETVCSALKVPYRSASLQVSQNPGMGVEAAAREARYQWFEQQLTDDACLLTAHHLQDRAETLLLNLLRGAGIRGLSSMRPARQFHQAKLVRPLLAFSRVQLSDYACKNELLWIEDPSNQQNDYARNYLRNKVLPVLSEFRHDAVNKLARAADNLQQNSELLDEIATQDLQNVKTKPRHFIDASVAFCLHDIKSLSRVRQQNVLRYWLADNHLHSCSKSLINKLIDYVNTAPSTSSILQESGWQFRYFKGFLYVMFETEPLVIDVPWPVPKKPLQIDMLNISITAQQSLLSLLEQAQYLDAQLGIVTRQQGESINGLEGKTIHLKKWMQQKNIPTWRRFRTPLLVLNLPEKTVFLGLLEDWVIYEYLPSSNGVRKFSRYAFGQIP